MQREPSRRRRRLATIRGSLTGWLVLITFRRANAVSRYYVTHVPDNEYQILTFITAVLGRETRRGRIDRFSSLTLNCLRIILYMQSHPPAITERARLIRHMRSCDDFLSRHTFGEGNVTYARHSTLLFIAVNDSAARVRTKRQHTID